MKHIFSLTVFLLVAVTFSFPKGGKAQKADRASIYFTHYKDSAFPSVHRYSEFHRDNFIYNGSKTNKDNDPKSTLIQAARLSKLIGYHPGATTALSLLGDKYRKKGQYDSSLLYYKQALVHSASILPNKGATAEIYVSIGKVYDHLSEEANACFYMYKGLENLELGNVDFKDENTIKNAYNVYRHVGAFWMGLNDMEKALIYLDKAIFLSKLSKDRTLHHDALLVKGTLHFRKKNMNAAIKYYTALLNEPSVHLSTRILADQNMARIYLRMPDKNSRKKSLPYLLEAYKLSKENDYKYYMLHTQTLLAVLYGFVGDVKKSEQLLINVLKDTCKTSLGTQTLSLQHKNLALLYESLGKYKPGFEQMQKVVALQDTLIQTERTKSISEFEFKYRAAEKDKLLAQKELQVSRQQKQLQRQYTLLIGGGLGALLTIFTLVLLLRVRKQKVEIDRLKAVMQGEEKERTRMARELHDGAVSSLSGLRLNLSALPLQHPEMKGAVQDLQRLLRQLDQNIEDLRNTSHNLLPEILHQAGLAEAVRIYTSNISGLGHLDIEFMMIGQLPALKQDFQLTVYRIIQELINNIIKHAHATHALVQFQVMKGQLNITVDDNGNGIPFFNQQQGNGIGLQNLKSRVRALNGTIEIESNKGTSVYITFNLQPFTGSMVKNRTQGIAN